MKRYQQKCPVCEKIYFIEEGEKILQCSECNSKEIKKASLIAIEDGQENPKGNGGTSPFKSRKKRNVQAFEDTDDEDDVKERKHIEGDLLLCCNGKGDFKPIIFKQKDSPVTLGREEKCGALLDLDNRVSRNHCVLEYVENDGHWNVRDNNSSNGTFLDGEEVFQETKPLHIGSVLRLGNQPDSFSFLVKEGEK